MEILIKGVSNFILRNINLKINRGDRVAILGPNGAGKTTLLNSIAGLINFEGDIFFNNLHASNIPVEKRKIGYIFQDLFLFPHMTVFENVTYGVNGTKEYIESEVNYILELLQINNLKTRYPSKLSGGEKQKVAIARALAIKPKLLLLDEPFKSISEQSSIQLQFELKQLLDKLRITTVYVTHNFLEAEKLTNRIVFLDRGKIVEICEKSREYIKC